MVTDGRNLSTRGFIRSNPRETQHRIVKIDCFRSHGAISGIASMPHIRRDLIRI
jgi:hypothetical protein